ncbi:uncharacterized protein LOC134674868 [Cydia fagiglandana]|uniref:uncharacterized protein LOC134674868 n=1 Tax=Cydia fagiglandana TaxID=1458189 RepID=UPI002FEE2CFF
MDEIKKMLQNIQDDIQKQKQDMKEMEENIKESINKNIDQKFSLIETRTSQLKEKIEKQQIIIDQLDNKLRKKNLVFFGVQEVERNYDALVKLILDIINNKMEIKCQWWEIENVSRIGKKSDKVRPVIVTITTIGRKLELIRCKKKLEDTGIYIKEDYSPAVLQKRRELQEELKRERQAGKNVALRHNKIITLKSHPAGNRTPNDNQSKKRMLSESPDAVEVVKSNEEKTKQQAKKTRPQSITNYLRPPQLNLSTNDNNNDDQKTNERLPTNNTSSKPAGPRGGV